MTPVPPSVRDVHARVRPRRRIEGISAVLMPFRRDGIPDLDAFAGLIDRTLAAGLRPAVNMDTGYVHVLSSPQRQQVLATAHDVLAGRPFVAGAFVEDGSGPALRRYQDAVAAIVAHGGTPILFPCTELQRMSGEEVVALHREVARGTSGVLAFELGEAFAPFGRIFDRDTVTALIETDGVLGLKHSSLSRRLEWERLEIRDARRPEFKVYTGNDLAIDMVQYGSDYLLGLSAFAPEAFARRDQYWLEGDARFHEVNDVLQYLGAFAFRPPTPAYRHSAAQFLKITGHLVHDGPPAGAPSRPDSDRAVLAEIARDLQAHLGRP